MYYIPGVPTHFRSYLLAGEKPGRKRSTTSSSPAGATLLTGTSVQLIPGRTEHVIIDLTDLSFSPVFICIIGIEVVQHYAEWR